MNLLSTKILAFILISLAAALQAQESFAQWGGSQGTGIPGMRRGAGRNNPNTDGSSNAQNSAIHAPPSPGSHLLTYEQIETRLTQLEQNLNLNNEQMKLWNSFAAKVRLYASDVAKERSRLNSELNVSSDGLKYLNQSSEDAKSRYITLKEIDDAAKPLYKSLNPEQKSNFDKNIPTFIATTAKSMMPSQPNYNIPDLGGASSPIQKQESNSLPGYIHQ